LLSKYTGTGDIAVGTLVSGRKQKELMKPIGLFINTLVLRSHVSSELSYRDFLSQVKTTTLDAYHHQELYFDSLVDLLKPERRVYLCGAPFSEWLGILKCC
jgi:non-ribosomal peptide synthetase component F